jgi:effector-binding domain-containing protein
MEYSCEIKEQPAQPILSIQTRTPVQMLPQVLGRAFDALMQHLASHGEYPAGAPFVAYYNMDMQDLDLEIGFPVTHPVEGSGEIESGSIPAGRFGSTLHTGPYPEIGPAYETLTAWLRRQGLEPTGVAYEYYLNDPQATCPEDLQTLVSFPLK